MRGDCFREANPLVTSKLPPLGQVPDFLPFISVGPSLSALTLGAVTNHPLTVTYSVLNLPASPVSHVLLPATLPSGVTFQSAVPLPHRYGQPLEFNPVLSPLLNLAAVTSERTKVC